MNAVADIGQEEDFEAAKQKALAGIYPHFSIRYKFCVLITLCSWCICRVR